MYKKIIHIFSQSKGFVIPRDKLDCQFSRSSGPGGQHVNKTNSKAEVRFNVANADWLNEYQKKKILEKYPNFVNKAGEIIVTSQFSREQSQNLNEAIEKLQFIVEECSKPEKSPFIVPPISEHKTYQRIEKKRHRSDIKKSRTLK